MLVKEQYSVIVYKEPYALIESITSNMRDPSVFNGEVSVVKHKITIEKLEESKEVYRQRLQKLWETSDNFHHLRPLKEKAKELGVELTGGFGEKGKRGRK